MFGAEFYPCPSRIAFQMLSKVSTDARYFLEPSAGKGDIAEVVRGHKYDGYGSNGKYGSHYSGSRTIDCIESSPELVSVLLGKDLPVVGYDWLDYAGVCYYDAILMNPPFSNGDDHLLKAWDFMHDGEIVCLLNEETIKNPHTEARKRLVGIIEKFGTVEYLGDCFSSAQRKTGVNVAMVYLKKASDDDTVDLWARASEEKDADGDIGNEPNMLAIRDNLGNMQHWYDSANEHMAKAFAHLRKAAIYMKANGISSDYDKIPAMAFDNVNNARAEFSKKHRHDAWLQVFQKMEFRKWLDKKQTDEFIRDIERSSDVPFTKENIKGTLQNVWLQRGKLFEKSVANVFDELTRYFNANTSHTEGWKSNDSYKVNQKLVFPWGCSFDSRFRHNFNLSYGRSTMDIYDDLDRIMCVLDGENFEECLTIGKALRFTFDKIGNCRAGYDNKTYSSYFNITFYKKGTIHLVFRDPKLWEKFNITAAKGKKWIGESTQAA